MSGEELQAQTDPCLPFGPLQHNMDQGEAEVPAAEAGVARQGPGNRRVHQEPGLTAGYQGLPPAGGRPRGADKATEHARGPEAGQEGR